MFSNMGNVENIMKFFVLFQWFETIEIKTDFLCFFPFILRIFILFKFMYFINFLTNYRNLMLKA